MTMTRPQIASGNHLTPPLEQRASNVMARASLRRELRLIALDLLGPIELDDCTGETAEWVERTTDTTVSAPRECAGRSRPEAQPPEPGLLHGRPASVIVDEARDFAPDLVVVGSRWSARGRTSCRRTARRVA